MNSISSKDQLRWVILLLAIAVILPTVCLLYFMTQAVKNERLAVRQKLIDSYTSRAQGIFSKDPEIAIEEANEFSASIIYDQNDKIIYPVPSSQRIIYSSDNVQKVWKTEFSDANYVEAIKEYDKIASISSIPDEVYQSKMGIIRCLVKQSKFDDAIKICPDLAWPGKHIINEFTDEQIAHAKLMLVSLYSKAEHENLLDELQNQLANISESAIPTEMQVFVLEKLIKQAEKSDLAEKLNTEIQTAKKMIDSASLSITAADYFDTNTAAQDKQDKTFFKIQTAEPLYCIKFKNETGKTVNILTAEKMKQLWRKSVDDFTDELVFCRIYDDKGNFIAGTSRMYEGTEVVFGAKFLEIAPGKNFGDWKVELYFQSGIFSDAAKRQRSIYIWTAILAITLMIFVTSFATKTLLRQAKLNTLKNDFIATVTHELKTPLASMRVLVDTLLEGNYNDRQQATEYLQLISKENKRLTGLIDNFLTFSRMERNKQAFEIAPTSPAEIAKDAAHALKTKFARGSCEFTMNIPDNIADIYADHDAMVTVLVNLLDNAYKYSGENKHIELSLYQHESSVFFKVKDNGIGMGPRVTRKIFDRFYQADSRLARSAEGCGLGLSIVKFIIDAHKGNIEVQSKPDKGTEFTIILPIIKE